MPDSQLHFEAGWLDFRVRGGPAGPAKRVLGFMKAQIKHELRESGAKFIKDVKRVQISTEQLGDSERRGESPFCSEFGVFTENSRLMSMS